MTIDDKLELVNAQVTPTKEAQEFESQLTSMLSLRNRYDAARLFIGRSLDEPDAPPPVPAGSPKGTAIRGHTLLGDDIDAWLALVLIQGRFGAEASSAHVRAALEAHWHRGATLVRDEFQNAGSDKLALVRSLASRLPAVAGAGGVAHPGGSRVDAVEVRIGSVSRLLDTDEPVSVVLNDAGTSPHVAFMGKTRSGKTQTCLRMALEIAASTALPLLFIDPKGEFVVDRKLANWPESRADPPTAIEVGSEPIPLDFLPDPNIGDTEIARAAHKLRDSIARCCTGIGNVQQDMLREAIGDAIRRPGARDLAAVRDAYQHRLQQAGSAKSDSVLSRLNEVSGTLRLFEPELTPDEFMRRSWVIGLSKLPGDELRRLAILLLLDAVADHVIGQPDAHLVNGFRRLRHLLVIDEARKILAQRKYESLSDLVRQGAAKGEVVMLLSQDPSDFVGQADDFTTQLGTVIAFQCAQSTRGLADLRGAYGRKLQPQEFSDTYLDRGVAFAKLPNREPTRVRAWQPDIS